MAKGDKIVVAVEGIAGTLDTTASQNGRTVSYEFENEGKIQWIVVKENTRGGTTVQESRYPADKVVALERVAKEI